MADPISMMAVASLVGTAVGGGVSAYGAYSGGQAQKSMFNYQSRVAQINAGIAQNQAQTEFAAGDIQAQQVGFRSGERMGITRAGIGAGNLDLGTGSARRVLSSEAMIGQNEQATVRNNAARRAYGEQVSAFTDTAQSNVDIAAGKGAVQAADFNVASSILGAATSTSDKWTKFGQAGALPPSMTG